MLPGLNNPVGGLKKNQMSPKFCIILLSHFVCTDMDSNKIFCTSSISSSLISVKIIEFFFFSVPNRIDGWDSVSSAARNYVGSPTVWRIFKPVEEIEKVSVIIFCF